MTCSCENCDNDICKCTGQDCNGCICKCHCKSNSKESLLRNSFSNSTYGDM